MPVTLSVRGITRRKKDICSFPPLRVEFNAKPAVTSIFKGQKSLKLVTHCQQNEAFQQYVLLEYAAYRLYNALTPESFRVRLAKIDYVDQDGHIITSRVGFFIEDVDDVAKRNGQDRLRRVNRISISQLDPAAAARLAVFQYMIGNLDWAMIASLPGEDCCHNARLIGVKGATTGLIPVPYDFDFQAWSMRLTPCRPTISRCRMCEPALSWLLFAQRAGAGVRRGPADAPHGLARHSRCNAAAQRRISSAGWQLSWKFLRSDWLSAASRQYHEDLPALIGRFRRARGPCLAHRPQLTWPPGDGVKMKETESIFSMLSVQSDKSVLGQGLFGDSPVALGWAGFQDLRFIMDSLSILLLATILGAVIGYHPATRRSIDHLHEAEMPHVYVMYAVVGAVIGVAVREFGMVVGVVIFGIGGLLRFRSSTDSVRDTVRLIIVTLVGLIAGLDLPNFAVLTTLFAFGLIYYIDSSPPYRIRIEGFPKGRATDCADAYRKMLKEQGCKIIAEHQSLEKGRIEFLFRLSRRSTRETRRVGAAQYPADLRSDVDWEVGSHHH